MANPYVDYNPAPSSFGTIGAIVTPGNTDLEPIAKAVICLTAGNITIVPVGNSNEVTLSFVGVPAGFVPPYQVKRVVSGTTATVATISG